MSTDDLRVHLRKLWPTARIEEFTWNVGGIQESLPDFRVARISPEIPANPWVYVSLGAHKVVPRSGPRLEFALLAPKEDPIHVETLAMVADFHAAPEYEIYLGKVLDIGRPWVDRSPCDHLLLSVPYPFSQEFELVRVSDSEMRILWLLPITRAEAQLAHQEGVEALESRLEKKGVDVLKVKRRSVV